jgi:3-oxoacyl-[acyl-carrier-protein] synthase II
VTEMRMAIEGVGVAGGFGSGIGALDAAMNKGRVATSRATIETGAGQKDIPVYLAETAGLEEFFQRRDLRRIDHHTKLALFAASLALKDAGRLGDSRDNTAVVVATGYGPHGTTFAFLDSFSSPTQFASSVHNAAAAYAAIFLKATGPSLTVSQFDMSVSSALLTAWCWLKEGCVDTVLFGAVDDYSSVLGYCYHRFFGLGDTPGLVMEPLQFDSQTAIPGEGSAFFVLSLEERRARYGFVSKVESGGALRTDLAGGDQSLIIGADGHRESGRHYVRLASRAQHCYTHLYGSMPTGQALDMAVASLLLARETGLTCLRLSPEGAYGAISLCRA